MSAPIFYISPEEFATCEVGKTYTLSGTEAHHAHVKRLQTGERLDLSDGAGNRAAGTIAYVHPDSFDITIHNIQAEQHQVSIYLVQALAKDHRDLLAIETATELGIRGIIPWSADRSIVQWKGQRAVKAHQKWQNTVAAAAKQSRRSFIPQVQALQSTADLASYISEVASEGAHVYILHEQAQTPLSEQIRNLQNLSDSTAQALYLVVGPEGGISEREVELLRQAGAHPARLGDEILRSSTAGTAALCSINVLLGLW